MTALHCWHCGARIAQQDDTCSSCGTTLTKPHAWPRYGVVGRKIPARLDPGPPEPLRLWSPQWWARFIARHWRGELALDASFWGATVVLTVGVVLIADGVAGAISDLGSAVGPVPLPDDYARIVSATGIFLGAVSVWQVVGTWRSAGRWLQQSPRPRWGIAARVALVPYGLLVTFSAVSGIATLV